MALPPNAIIEVSYRGKLLGQQVINTFHYRVATPSGNPSVSGEMEQLIPRFTSLGPLDNLTAYRGACTESYQIEQCVLQPIFPTRFRRLVATLTTQGVVDPTEVSNVQAAITFVTAKAGRSQIGGVRIPSSPQLAIAGSWQGPYVNSLGACGQAFSETVAAVAGGGFYTPVIYHRGANANPKFDDIEDYIVQRTTRVIRRRTVGVGI